MTANCQNCDAPMPALTNRGTPRKFCSRRCVATYRHAATKGITAEEAEFLLSCGSSPAQIARQLGIEPDSVAKALRRAGRPDLAPQFERLRNVDRRHPCADCGKDCYETAERCLSCARHTASA